MYRKKLLNGEVAIEDLIITKHMSRNPRQYRQHVSQVIAAERLTRQGQEVHAGNSVKFLFTHSEDKRFDRRVRAAELIEKGVEPNVKKYLMLLYSAAANMLSFDGYTDKLIYDSIREQRQKSLPKY